MNSFDLVFWAAAALLVARLCDRRAAPLAAARRSCSGWGCSTRSRVLFFGAGLAVALVADPAAPAPLRAGALARRGLAGPPLPAARRSGRSRTAGPRCEFIENATRYKNVALEPAAVPPGARSPRSTRSNAPLWIAGLAWLLFARRGPAATGASASSTSWPSRSWPSQHSKPYYLGPAYPAAAGRGRRRSSRGCAGGWLRPASRRGRPARRRRRRSRPFAIPVLPVETFIAYQKALGVQAPQAEKERPRPAAAVLRRPLRLGGADRRGRARLRLALAGGAGARS